MAGRGPWLDAIHHAKFFVNAELGPISVATAFSMGTSMRLTLSAVLGAALLASPAFAHDHRRDDGPSPPYADLPPPGYYESGRPLGPQWERMRGEWAEHCRVDRDDIGDHDREGPDRHGCDSRGFHPYPGGYMGYAVPMIMVPVLRSKPCREIVEEVVEEVVPVRRRVIPPRPRIVPDKRVPLHDKRMLTTPGKRIPY